MSTCKHIQPLLADYIDDRLSSTDRKMVSTHLENCNTCQAYDSQLRTTISALKSYPEPRADFWDELDAQLDGVLETKVRPTTSWHERFSNWLLPIDQWASVTAGAILTIAVIFMLVTSQHQDFDIVMHQKQSLDLNHSAKLLSAYKAANVIGDDSQGSVHSFAPTVKTINYFYAGKLYAEAISAILVNHPTDLQNKLDDLRRSLHTPEQTNDISHIDIEKLKKAMLSGQTNKALTIVSQIKKPILDDSRYKIGRIEFDLGGWSVGFRYQLIMKSIDIERERITIEDFLTRIENQGDSRSLIAQLTTINNILNAASLSDTDYTSLESAIKNIDYLLG